MPKTETKNEKKVKPRTIPKPTPKTQKGLPEIEVSYTAIMKRELFYPLNASALDMAYLMRRKCFTPDEIKYMKKMGFNINVKPQIMVTPTFDD